MKLPPSILIYIATILILFIFWFLFPSSAYSEFTYYFTWTLLPTIYFPAFNWWRKREASFGPRGNKKALLVALFTALVVYSVLAIGAFINLIFIVNFHKWTLNVLLPDWRHLILLSVLTLVGFFFYKRTKSINDSRKLIKQKRIESFVFNLSFLLLSVITVWQLRI